MVLDCIFDKNSLYINDIKDDKGNVLSSVDVNSKAISLEPLKSVKIGSKIKLNLYKKINDNIYILVIGIYAAIFKGVKDDCVQLQLVKLPRIKEV